MLRSCNMYGALLWERLFGEYIGITFKSGPCLVYKWERWRTIPRADCNNKQWISLREAFKNGICSERDVLFFAKQLPRQAFKAIMSYHNTNAGLLCLFLKEDRLCKLTGMLHCAKPLTSNLRQKLPLIGSSFWKASNPVGRSAFKNRENCAVW